MAFLIFTLERSNMARGKPRHNPEKPQNNYNKYPYTCCEEIPQPDGSVYLHCENNIFKGDVTKFCGGNTHNCKSAQLRLAASINK